MCTYPIFLFTTDATRDTSDLRKSIDSPSQRKKSNKRTFLYLLTSFKCGYDIIEPGQRYYVQAYFQKLEYNGVGSCLFRKSPLGAPFSLQTIPPRSPMLHKTFGPMPGQVRQASFAGKDC